MHLGCIGNILVVFMFDMNAWGKLFQKCRFMWSTLKEGRRERSKPFHERQMVVNDRIPMITSMANDRVIKLGDMIIPRLVCEGLLHLQWPNLMKIDLCPLNAMSSQHNDW